MFTIKYTAPPMMCETHLFTDFPFAAAKEARTVTFDLHFETKTRLFVSMRFGVASVSTNYVPKGSEGLKFDEQQKNSYATGNRITVSYFKVTTKQRLAALEQHLCNIAKDALKLADEDTEPFVIEVWRNRVITSLEPTGYLKVA